MTNKSFLFNHEPIWREHRQGSQHKQPAAIQSWTFETGSLTQRLRNTYGNTVTVTILFHQWRTPYLSEKKRLHLPLQRKGLIREVMLHSNGKPLLLARTIIPEPTIRIAHRNLSHLGTKPLGEVIFTYPDLERISLDVTCIGTEHWSAQARQQAHINQAIWGRRTVYAIHHHPLLVSEFFLPEILEH